MEYREGYDAIDPTPAKPYPTSWTGPHGLSQPEGDPGMQRPLTDAEAQERAQAYLRSLPIKPYGEPGLLTPGVTAAMRALVEAIKDSVATKALETYPMTADDIREAAEAMALTQPPADREAAIERYVRERTESVKATPHRPHFSVKITENDETHNVRPRDVEIYADGVKQGNAVAFRTVLRASGKRESYVVFRVHDADIEWPEANRETYEALDRVDIAVRSVPAFHAGFNAWSSDPDREPLVRTVVELEDAIGHFARRMGRFDRAIIRLADGGRFEITVLVHEWWWLNRDTRAVGLESNLPVRAMDIRDHLLPRLG